MLPVSATATGAQPLFETHQANVNGPVDTPDGFRSTLGQAPMAGLDKMTSDGRGGLAYAAR